MSNQEKLINIMQAEINLIVYNSTHPNEVINDFQQRSPVIQLLICVFEYCMNKYELKNAFKGNLPQVLDSIIGEMEDGCHGHLGSDNICIALKMKSGIKFLCEEYKKYVNKTEKTIIDRLATCSEELGINLINMYSTEYEYVDVVDFSKFRGIPYDHDWWPLECRNPNPKKDFL